MRLKEVKIGQSCFCYDGYYHYRADSPYEERKVTVEGIERADRDKGIGYSRVQCRKDKTGELFLIDPYFLTPFDEHLKDLQMAKIEVEENRVNAEIILKAAGEGSQIEGPVGRRQVTLLFTETAAERLLAACGAKPIPDNRRPRRQAGREEYNRLSTLLSRRIGRALGGGYVPGWTGRDLHDRGGGFEARIALKGEEIAKAAKATSGKKEKIDSGALGELIG